MKSSKGKLSRRTRKIRRRKITVLEHVKEFSTGEGVVIDIQPYFKGMPHQRYKGKHGKVVRRCGGAYVIEVYDGNAKKQLSVLPVHLKKIGWYS